MKRAAKTVDKMLRTTANVKNTHRLPKLNQRSFLNDKYLISDWSITTKSRVEKRPLARGRSQAYLESRIGEIKAKFLVLYESFERRRTRTWSEIYWALWNCWFYCDSGLFLLRRERFVE